jgi:anhydro-N-acetylmuramic acid kinase
MVYRAIGLMSGSSLDGLDIVLAEFHENGGAWQYTIKAAETAPYSKEWADRLKNAIHLNALDYQLLHAEYGHYTGQQVNAFIERHGLQFQVQLIASHGHTTFHLPAKKMTAQLGDGAAIAATTGINVVSDLRAINVALSGQGAPIVPIGEKLLFGNYPYFLNLGGIANISCNCLDEYVAFDVCPANRVLNMLANDAGKPFDAGGHLAASGTLQPNLLTVLNDLEYYRMPYPKSLANDFGTDVVYTLIKNAMISTPDALRTFVEHVAMQVKAAVGNLGPVPGKQPGVGKQSGGDSRESGVNTRQLLITGGGAHNTFLIERLKAVLQELQVEVIVPEVDVVDFKEAIVMALIGLLRWREENNVLASVTGATRDSIGGAVWIGQEA